MNSNPKYDVLKLLNRIEIIRKTKIPGPASSKDLERMISQYGELPDMFTDWLNTSNAPKIGPSGFIFGLTKNRVSDIPSMYELYPEWKLKKWIPVSGDGCGSYYLIIPQNTEPLEPVVFWDHESGLEGTPDYVVGSDIWHFLRFFLAEYINEREGVFPSEYLTPGWPFDKDAVVASDPEILRVKNIPMPWEVD